MACLRQPLCHLRLTFNPCRPEHLGKEPIPWAVRPDADGASSGLQPGRWVGGQ